jgi:hypothetical protein
MAPAPEISSLQPEAVYSVLDYYDGPRSGIANFQGRPHFYYQPLEQYGGSESNNFLVQPVDEETFRLAMEDWAIWCKWERAFLNGETTEETHPALSEDRARHEELERILSAALRIEPGKALQVKAQFEACRPAEPGLTSTAEWRVLWIPS